MRFGRQQLVQRLVILKIFQINIRSDTQFCVFILDTFKIYYFHKHSNETIQLNISKENLAWNTDRSFKFKNPLGNN